MRESREALLIVPDSATIRMRWPERAAAADSSSEPVLAAIEAVVAMAEVNPEGARVALWRLQSRLEDAGARWRNSSAASRPRRR